ncbi:hypothetical protein L1987_04443 [Smallanthus sonchifolius]|uniref:Uncharacterized protein n=1 Tax=Smallanthus sonchifolius TaxID=185202 RepID=A0ACB9KDK3_9ASTR|nr:hypothetical protein L1987_04443 [Smallanthus sonchifolius]
MPLSSRFPNHQPGKGCEDFRRVVADLRQGFVEDVECILGKVNDATKVQTVLFSATLPSWVYHKLSPLDALCKAPTGDPKIINNIIHDFSNKNPSLKNSQYFRYDLL